MEKSNGKGHESWNYVWVHKRVTVLEKGQLLNSRGRLVIVAIRYSRYQ